MKTNQRRARRVTIPFGKHKGKRLEDIPGGYLRWAAENVQSPKWLVDAVKVEVERRATHSPRNEPQTHSSTDEINQLLMEVASR